MALYKSTSFAFYVYRQIGNHNMSVVILTDVNVLKNRRRTVHGYRQSRNIWEKVQDRVVL